MHKLFRIILTMLPLAAFAAEGDRIGSAEGVSGEGFIEAAPLVNGSALTVGDRIGVGSGADASFRLTNGYLFSLGEMSSSQALSYVFSPSGATPNAARFNLSGGSARVLPPAGQGTGEFALVTPAGEVTSANGAFAVVICGANCSGRKGVFVSVLSGSVVITNQAGVVIGESGQTFFLGSFDTVAQLLTSVPDFVATIVGAFPAVAAAVDVTLSTPVGSITLDFLAGVCETSVSPSETQCNR